MTNHNPYDPTATPNFDEWGPDDYWSKADWLTWHNTLKNEFGTPMGNDVWVSAWNSRTGVFTTLGDVRANWLGADLAFRNYLDDHKISSGVTMLEAVTDPLSDASAAVAGIFGSAGQSLGNIGTTVTRTTKTLSWLLPLAAVAAVVIAGYLLIKANPLKSIS